MFVIETINLLDTTAEGPLSWVDEENQQEVFLRQGSLDGACGPYSVMMSLLACSVVRREDVVGPSRRDGRTLAGKLLKALDEYSGLFSEGTDIRQLQKLVEDIFRAHLNSAVMSGTGRKIRDFTIEHVRQNHPVVLGLEWSEDGERQGHWVLVVGLDGTVDDETGLREVNRFLVLDPSEDTPRVSSWNGVISAQGTGSRYPYQWWNHDCKVRFFDALAVWPK